MSASNDNPKTNSLQSAQVALVRPIFHLLTYKIPSELQASIQPGAPVLVSVGTGTSIGYVVSVSEDQPTDATKSIFRILTDVETLDASTLDLLVWAASYYCHPPGQALQMGTGVDKAITKTRLVPTSLGRKLVETGPGLLQVGGLELDDRERRVIERLVRAKGPLTKTVLIRSTGVGAAVVDKLVRRELLERIDDSGPGPKARTTLLAKLARRVTEEEREALVRRAPKMAAILQALEDANEPLFLEQIRRDDKGAAARLKKMEQKGLVTLERKVIEADPFVAFGSEPVRDITLSSAQVRVLDRLEQALDSKRYHAFLLHGVTSSGKTEVYLRLIGRALDQGGKALVLVPEIALTPQLSRRFHQRFPDKVAVLHSGLTKAAKRQQWAKIRKGSVRIVVGARSALFAPMGRLSVVVVDEEHDPSFKQHDNMPYHGRDLAVVRARQSNAVVVLGSATPSLESYRNASTGRYELLELPERATPRPLPQVEIVDLKKYNALGGAFTAPMLDGLRQTLDAGKQAICFLNRRGFAPNLVCRECGQAVRCPHCSVSLTWHKRSNTAVCHYCGHVIPTPTTCPECGAPDPMPIGLGTERLASMLENQFPGARVARLDRDSARFGRMNIILERVRNGEVDILVGTQMVAKGHDFPGVTFVGVVLADQGLNFPDFRAAERTYQLLSQVAGRAGRGDEPGRVVIQTYNPHHHAVTAARDHDYATFYTKEAALRKRYGYPPFGHLAAVRFDGTEERLVVEVANEIAAWMKQESRAIDVLGPSEAPLSKLRGKTRWHLLAKSARRKDLHELMSALAARRAPKRSDVRMTIDIDPQDMM